MGRKNGGLNQPKIVKHGLVTWLTSIPEKPALTVTGIFQ